jgi:hypothetical protein
MKKSVYPNQGHLIKDFYVDDISRAYEDNGNLIVVLGSSTGIEDHNSIYKNESARLIIPSSLSIEFANNITRAAESLASNKDESRAEQKTDSCVEDNVYLGEPFPLGK